MTFSFLSILLLSISSFFFDRSFLGLVVDLDASCVSFSASGHVHARLQIIRLGELTSLLFSSKSLTDDVI